MALVLAPSVGSSTLEAKSWRIGEIGELTHKSQRAVRLYEEMGLLGAVVRTEGGHRLYGRDTLLRIGWIDKLQSLGFSLTQVQKLLEDWTGEQFAPQAMARVKEIFTQKLEETRAQIKLLGTLEGELSESLSYLQSCEVCDPSTLLASCAGCSCHHEPAHAPTLVVGFHTGGSKL